MSVTPNKITSTDEQRLSGDAITAGSATADECLDVYKRMGHDRSYRKVALYFKNMGRKCVAVPTLKTWGKKGNWGYHARVYDEEVAKLADQKIQAEQAEEMAVEVRSLAVKMRNVANKALKRLSEKVGTVGLKSGGEFKAMAEAAVSLQKAAEVMDGGVSDRTERVSTLEERKSKAAQIVDDAFKNFAGGGQNNGKSTEQPVDNAADAGRSAA